jgi:hypothetical protein
MEHVKLGFPSSMTLPCHGVLASVFGIRVWIIDMWGMIFCKSVYFLLVEKHQVVVWHSWNRLRIFCTTHWKLQPLNVVGGTYCYWRRHCLLWIEQSFCGMDGRNQSTLNSLVENGDLVRSWQRIISQSFIDQNLKQRHWFNNISSQFLTEVCSVFLCYLILRLFLEIRLSP